VTYIVQESVQAVSMVVLYTVVVVIWLQTS